MRDNTSYSSRSTVKENLSGMLIIDKPLACSSMDVIRVLRRLTGIKKIGHAGTLDPLATGVLLVCIGRAATKQIDQLMNTEKEYVAEVNLTAFSETDDAEGPLHEVCIEIIPPEDDIKKCLQSFIGLIKQVPPQYSAIKVNGVRSYKKARKGKFVELKPRTVEIKSIDILSYSWPLLKIKVTCGKGVYIRSLARDVGKSLCVGGYISALRRTRVGAYDEQKAIALIDLQDKKILVEDKIVSI